jgi:hypothetical protein
MCTITHLGAKHCPADQPQLIITRDLPLTFLQIRADDQVVYKRVVRYVAGKTSSGSNKVSPAKKTPQELAARTPTKPKVNTQENHTANQKR